MFGDSLFCFERADLFACVIVWFVYCAWLLAYGFWVICISDGLLSIYFSGLFVFGYFAVVCFDSFWMSFWLVCTVCLLLF